MSTPTPVKYLLLFTGFSACAQFDSGKDSLLWQNVCAGALAAFVNYLRNDLGLTTKAGAVGQASRQRQDVGSINAMELRP